MNNLEDWTDVGGYEGIYEVSSFGNIRSKSRIVAFKAGGKHKSYNRMFKGVYLKPGLDERGYRHISLARDGVSKTKKICGLVAKAFIRNPFHYPEVNHQDGDKTNDNISNLEWVTSSENKLHALRNGLKIPAKGVKIATAKLNDNKVREIRKLKREGYSYSELSRLFGVAPETVFAVVTRITWKHI